MSEVIVYANSVLRSYCQIKLDSGERVLISILSNRKAGVKVMKLSLFGFWPTATLWEYTPTKAGGEETFFQNMIAMFPDTLSAERRHPLDIVCERLLLCKSTAEVRTSLQQAERSLAA